METRGRLSSLDMLPDEAQDDVKWAVDQLKARQRTQADILFEFNDRLAVKGIPPVSKSAFNRKSVRIAYQMSMGAETREIFAAVTKEQTPDQIDAGVMALNEMVKTAIASLLDQEQTPGAIAEITDAYYKLIRSQTMYLDYRKKRGEFEKKASAAIDAAAKAVEQAHPGVDLSATVKRIREEIYGIFEASP